MSKANLRNELTELIKKNHEGHEAFNEAKEDLHNQLRNERITDKVFHERLALAQEEREQERLQISEKAEAIFDKLEDIIKKENTPKGEDIIDEDMKLLNSGIELTRDEVMVLMTKYREENNSTMLRALKGKAEGWGITVPVASLEDKLVILGQSKRVINRGLNDTQSYHGYSINENHREKTLDNLFKGL